MDKIYELSESSLEKGVPDLLETVLSFLPEHLEENLFLALVFVLSVETFGRQTPSVQKNAEDWFLLELMTPKTFHRWTFANNVNVTIEFVQTPNGLNALVSGVVKNFGCSTCLQVTEYVPDPKNKRVPLKFANLCDLSSKIRSMFWLCRIESLSMTEHPDKTALENLPEHILERIAFFLPKFRLGQLK